MEVRSVYVQFKDLVNGNNRVEMYFVFIVSGNVICLQICFRKCLKCSPAWSFKNIKTIWGPRPPITFFGTYFNIEVQISGKILWL
jgi:hypothetical protein